jgi:MFS family permease
VISASIASQTIGMAIGPVIGGYLVAEAGYRAISILGVSCHLGTLVLLVILMHGPRQTKLTIRDVP